MGRIQTVAAIKVLKRGSMKNKKIITGICLIFILIACGIISYRSQIKEGLGGYVKDTWLWEHKSLYQTYTVLDADNPFVSERILCTVPQLHTISFYVDALDINAEAEIGVLVEKDTGEAVADITRRLLEVADGQKARSFEIPVDDADSEGHEYEISIRVDAISAGTVLIETNVKQGVVCSFNGDPSDRHNIVSGITYGDVSSIRMYFLIWGILLGGFIVLAYYLYVIRDVEVTKAFPILAIYLGVLIQLLVPINGVPDETWHLDTAYKYSNYIVGAGSTGIPGTIYKRHGDVIMSDMLPNDIETGSYYQTAMHTFELCDDRELDVVTYYDTGTQVLFINFLPAAIGIGIGRLLGLSAMFTFQLGRIFNLMAYVWLVWMAVRIMPWGRYAMAAIAMFPISMQQAASLSYDPVLLGAAFLFTALCARGFAEKEHSVGSYIATAVLAVYLIFNKGAAYAPLILLVFASQKTVGFIRNNYKKCLLAAAVICVLLFAVFYVKFLPVLSSLSGLTDASDNGTVTLVSIIHDPAQMIRLFWNTIVAGNNNITLGVFGGILGWNNMQVSAIFPMLMAMGTLFLTGADKETYVNGRWRIFSAIAAALSSFIIMSAMMLAETQVGAKRISSLQGRYFIPVILVLFLAVGGDPVNLDEGKAKKVSVGMYFVTALMLVEVLVLAL